MSSQPLVGMQIATLKAQLDYIFSQIQQGILTEPQIKQEYETQTKKNLEEELRLTELSLPEFMRNSFYNMFNVVDDPSGMTFYIRRDMLLSQVSQRTIGAPTGTTSNGSNGLAPGAPRATNGNSYSHPITTPTPPPVVPSSRPVNAFNQGVPPGFPVTSSRNVVDRRMETLQKQLSDRGLEGVFHPDALRHHFGDLSELIQDDENQALFKVEVNGKNHNSNGGGLLNIDLDRVSPKLEFQSNLGNVFIEEFFDDQTFRDNQNEFGGIVETPDASDYEDMSEHFETVIINENANRSTFLNSNDKFPPIKQESVPSGFEKSVRPSSVKSNEFDFNFDAEPKFAAPKASSSDHKAPRPAITSFSLPPACNHFPIDMSKLFYIVVLRNGIQNSPEVNVYREEYRKSLEQNTNLYKPVSDRFIWLTGYHLSGNPNIGGFMPNHSFVIDLLQMYARRHPDGMKPKDLIEMEMNLCTVGQSVCLGQSTLIMSVPEMIDRGLLFAQNNVYRVDPEILEIELWKLPAGLTSNLYRVLNAQQVTMVQDVSMYEGILKNHNGDPVFVADEDIIRQANMFPLIFKIKAQAAEQNSMHTASIQINEKLPRWKVLLDQPSYPTIPFHCECQQCIPSGMTLPVLVRSI